MDSSKHGAPVAVTWPAPLLDAACSLAAQKWVVLLILLLGMIAGVIRLISLPSIYKASAVAVLMSREKPMLDAAIDTSSIEVSDDRAGRSDAGNLMLPPNPSLYTTLIKSRAVMSRIADTFSQELAGHLSPRDRSDEVVGILKSMVQVTSTEEGLITITVSSENPQLSAALANELFEECKRASKSIERQLILQQAGHLDDALHSAYERLALTETKLREFSARYGLIDVDLQAGNQLRSMRELAAEKDKLMGDLQELLLNYSERSPEVQRIRARITSLDVQQQGARESIVGSVGMDDFGGLVVAHDSLKQRVRFERDLVATLATKVDIYRIRAEQPTGNLAIIKAAIAPDRPSGPSKKMELGIILVITLVLATGWALGYQQWKSALRNRYIAGRVAELAGHLKIPAVVRILRELKGKLLKRNPLKAHG